MLVDHLRKEVWASLDCVPFERNYLPEGWAYKPTDEFISEGWLRRRVLKSIKADLSGSVSASTQSIKSRGSFEVKKALSPKTDRKIKRLSRLRADTRTYSSEELINNKT